MTCTPAHLAGNKRYRERHPDRVRIAKAKCQESPERNAYRHAKERCTNPKHKNWPEYGGRGIKFLFTSFEQFIAELGKRPDGLQLEPHRK